MRGAVARTLVCAAQDFDAGADKSPRHYSSSYPMAMHRIIHGETHGLSDASIFIETLSKLNQNPSPEARQLFDSKAEIVVARAPGRLDVMGGIADYSGSLVLELPIREETRVAVLPEDSGRLTLASGNRPELTIPLADLDQSYECAREYFQRDPARAWAAYVAGAFVVLIREKDLAFPEGARIAIDSTVPEGRGVASSAALEIWTGAPLGTW